MRAFSPLASTGSESPKVSDDCGDLRIRERALERWHHPILGAVADLLAKLLVAQARPDPFGIEGFHPGSRRHPPVRDSFGPVAASTSALVDRGSIGAATGNLAIIAGGNHEHQD